MTLFWSEGSISLSVRYSYLSILPYDKVDTFAASLLISYSNFSSPILSSVVMISFYILSERKNIRFFLKRKVLSDARAASITKEEYGLALHFL